jgi:hypothetical protein
MSKAPYRRIERGSNSGRFVVSEGVAPSAYMLGHPGLPTFYKNQEDDRYEIVIPQGTILTAVAGADGSSYVVPANGTATAFTWGDGQVVNVETGATPASASGTNVDTIVVPARSVPIGCAQQDVYRPFDRNTSFAASWITTGYVEWPMVQGVNADLAVGDVVRSDFMGRPVKAAAADFYNSSAVYDYLRVGKVVEIEKFATNFDFGLLNYMQLPSDPGALKDVYSITRNGPNKDLFGVRKNLDTVNAVGAVRVSLSLI